MDIDRQEEEPKVSVLDSLSVSIEDEAFAALQRIIMTGSVSQGSPVYVNQLVDHLDDDLALGLSDLQRKEQMMEGSLLVTQINLQSEKRESFLQSEEAIVRDELEKEQEVGRVQLVEHHLEEARQRTARFKTKTDAFTQKFEQKARDLNLAQVQTAHKLQVAHSEKALRVAEQFARQRKFLAEQRENQLQDSIVSQARQARNLSMRQQAARGTLKDTDARFVKREQHQQREHLKERLNLEQEQSRRIQAFELQHAQEQFDLKGTQQRDITKLQSLQLAEQQSLTSLMKHNLNKSKLAKLNASYEIKSRYLVSRHTNFAKQLALAQLLEMRQLREAQDTARKSRLLARTQVFREMNHNLKRGLDLFAEAEIDSLSDDSTEVEAVLIPEMESIEEALGIGLSESASELSQAAVLAAELLLKSNVKKAKALLEYHRQEAFRKRQEYENSRSAKESDFQKRISRHKTDLAKLSKEMTEAHKVKLSELQHMQRSDCGVIMESQSNELLKMRRSHIKEVEALMEKQRQSQIELVSAFPLERKYEELLSQILPGSVAEKVAAGQEFVAESHEDVCIVFVDLVGFTEKSGELEANELLQLLNKVFSRLDALCERHGLCKIKTIGDCFMCVSGLPERFPQQVQAGARFCLDVLRAFQTVSAKPFADLNVRIGMEVGDVIAGVIGAKKPVYDTWGPSVNLASRMESTGIAGKIQTSRRTKELLELDFEFEHRGKTDVKGVGSVETYFLLRECHRSPRDVRKLSFRGPRASQSLAESVSNKVI